MTSRTTTTSHDDPDLVRWLEQHRDADEIVVDSETGQPIKAVYTTLGGIKRRYPVEYYWKPMEFE